MENSEYIEELEYKVHHTLMMYEKTRYSPLLFEVPYGNR